MNQEDFERFIMELPHVQREENFGYLLFFVGDDHRLPFVTIANSDNDFDNVSNLDRDGVFRLNIGVSKETFNSLNFHVNEGIDYSILNMFLPHPHYAKQHFICILNPVDDNLEKTKPFILEAHSIAKKRYKRKKALTDEKM